jgi:hypothetical protein
MAVFRRAELPAPDRYVVPTRRQFFQGQNSDTCVPTTLMNAAKAYGRVIPRPDATLNRLNRVGPTDKDGTSESGMAREAHALGLGFRPLGRNVALAHRLNSAGVQVATDINPGRLPQRIQRSRGGPFESEPAGHEVLLRRVGPRGGAWVEDPQLGRYFLGPMELKQAIGQAGRIKALPDRRGWWR